jgi:hypothetical protein
MVLQFFVDGHTTCFGLYGHLQVYRVVGLYGAVVHAHMKMEIKENATRTNTN